MNTSHRIRLSGKFIVGVIAALVILTVAAAWVHFHGTDTSVDGYNLTISVYDNDGTLQNIKTYSLSEIEKMPTVHVHAKLQSAQKGVVEGTFTGVTLQYLLNHTDKKLLKEHKTFILSAGDGYSSAASRAEVARGKAVVIAFEKDGKPLGHFNEGGSGPMKAVFCQDTYGNRSTEFLVNVICR